MTAAAAAFPSLVGCGASTSPSHWLGRRSPPSPARPVAPQAWEAVVVPSNEQLTFSDFVAAEEEGEIDAVSGSLRLRLRAGHARPLREVPAEEIVSAGRIRGQWRFAMANGALLSSAEFDGPLRWVGGTDGLRFERGLPARGLLAMSGADGSLWVVDETLDLRRALGPEPYVIDAAFADARFGLVLVEPGRLLRTTDGGATFRPLPGRIDETDGLGLWLSEDAVLWQAAGATWRVRATGNPVRIRQPSSRTAEQPMGPSQPELRAAAIEANPWMQFGSDLALQGASLANGVLLTREEYLAPGDELRRLPRLPRYLSCVMYPYGEQILASCRDNLQGLNEVWLVEPGGDARRLFDVAAHSIEPQTGLHLYVSREDRGFLVPRHCGGDGARAAQGEMCWFDGATTRRVMVPGGRWIELVGTVVVTDSGWADLSTGEAGVTPLPPTLAPERLMSVGGGRVAFVGIDTRSRQYVVAFGTPRGPFVTRALPAGATQCAFADEQHGMAAGDRFGDLWATEDGGQRWQRLALLVQGDAEEVPLAGRGYPVNVQCTPQLCRAGHRVLWMPAALAARFRDAYRVVAPPARGAEGGGSRLQHDPR